MVEFQRKIAEGGTIGFDEEDETRALDGAKNEACSLLGCDQDELALLASSSEGVCSLAWSLSFKPRSNIVSTDAEFPSVTYAWMRLAHEKPLEIRLAKNRDGVVYERELERLVDDHTAVLAISHVEYGTGQRFNLRWLSDLAHSHGALLFVDATQSAGLIPIDARRDGVDAIVSSSYKGLLGPFGAALLYVKRELAESLTPALVGWRSTPDPYHLDGAALSFAKGVKKFEFSTLNYAAVYGLARSIHYLKQLEPQSITDHVLSLSEKLIQMVKSNSRLFSATPLTPKDSHSSIASFRFAGRDQTAIVNALINRNIIVSQRFNGVRFSFHAYNNEEDVEKTVDTLEAVFA